ncbi:hypothetical protein Y032_0157g3182 [Ancylostoma ceylanicum]|uniref:Zonadhesin n=1 Tax=Ancylostoma ceylanicum TaxID=53326 RepID=A0A016SZ24_9BILA|nr:hypothetical protein Y032_0157g3182 [Ancylostoma ceylanicum]
MVLLIFAILHCATLTSAKAIFRFHGAPEYGVMHDDRPASRRQNIVKTTVTSPIDEDVNLNLPHAIDQNTMTNADDRVSNNGEERKLPILRTEAEPAVKPAVQPQSTYVLMRSTDERVEPQREILHAAEVLDVSQSEGRPPPQREVVLRNSLTQVEVIPTDVVPVLITTTTTPIPTTITTTATAQPTSVTNTSEESQKIHDKKEPSLIEQVDEKGRVLEVIDHLPSAKTFVLDVAKDVLPEPAKEELPEESKTVVVASDAPKVEPTSVIPSEQRSKEEEEEADVLPEFDEKADVELEFHDDADIVTTSTPEVVTTSAAPEMTSSVPDTITEATSEELPTSFPDSAEKEFLAEEDIYDLIMFLITLLPEVQEQSRWSRIIAGLQCALRDCRRAFPRLTTVATPVGNGTFIIRRARSECLCSISRSQDPERP